MSSPDEHRKTSAVDNKRRKEKEEQTKPTIYRRLSKLHSLPESEDLFATAVAATARRASVSVSGTDHAYVKNGDNIQSKMVFVIVIDYDDDDDDDDG